MKTSPYSSFGQLVAAIDDRRADPLDRQRAVVGAEELIAIAAVDAAGRADRPHHRILAGEERLVEAAGAHEIRVARVVARRDEVREQRRVVHVPEHPPGIVLGRAPLAARERRDRLDLAVLQAQVEITLGRVHHVVHRPEQAVGVVLDGRGGPAVGVADQILGVGLEVAVGVLHQPEVRRLADEHALIQDLERARQHQLVGEDGALVHHAVAVGVFQRRRCR